MSLEQTANKFDGLSEGAKKFSVVLAAVAGAIVPIGVMLTGLAINFASFLVKAVQTLTSFITRVQTGATSMEYLSQEQMEAALAAEQLSAAENRVTAAINAQADAVANLGKRYVALAGQRGGSTGAPPIKMATGGNVPGAGNTDKIPALLTPGEFVVKKDQATKHRGFLTALNSGMVKGFNQGTAQISLGNYNWKPVASGTYKGAQNSPDHASSLTKIIDTLAKNIGSMSDAAAKVTASLNASAQEGKTAGVAISSLKQDLEGLGSYDLGSRARAHVIEPLERSTEQVTTMLTTFARESDSQAAKVVEGIMKLDAGVRDAVFDFEVMGSAVANLPESLNALMSRSINIDAGVGSGGILSAGGVAEQLQYGASDELFRTFGAQANALGVEMGEATQWAQGLTEALRQKVQTIADNNPEAIFVESQEDAAQVMEQYEQKWRDEGLSVEQIAVEREKLESNLYVLNNVVKDVVDDYKRSLSPASVDKFAKTWETVSNEAGAFRIKVKKGYEKYLAALERAGLTISGLGDKTTIQTLDKRASYRDASTVGLVGSQRSPVHYESQRGREAMIAAQAQEDQQIYNEAKDSVNGPEDDSWVQSQDEAARNSPHPGATQDGTDDGNAYIEAKRAAIEGGGKGAKGGLAGSSNKSNQRLAALQNQRATTTQQVVVANQQVVTASRRQVVAQNAMTSATNVATAAMTTVATSAKRFGAMLMQGSMKMTGFLGALSGGVFALSMFEGQFQDIAQKAMPVVMGLSALQMILPLLKNPWMALIAAVAAVAATIWFLNKSANDAIDASRRLCKSNDGVLQKMLKNMQNNLEHYQMLKNKQRKN